MEVKGISSMTHILTITMLQFWTFRRYENYLSNNSSER